MDQWFEARTRSRRRAWPWLRLAGGVVVLALLVAHVGAGPFLDGVRRVSPLSIVAALVITALTTGLSAWRWRLIAAGLGLDIPLRVAVTSYYRSQLLNSTLPGGVLGDVHRGVRQGQEAGQVARSLRSVAWDRAAGQAVQVVLAVVVLLAWPSPVRPAMAAIGTVTAIAVGGAALAVLGARRDGRSWAARLTHTIGTDLRSSLLTWERGPAVVLASAAVVLGHVAVFLVAAGAGSWDSVRTLLPLSLVVLLSMSVPTNVGGWGPREGVAAWAFATAGLGAAHGVQAATTYGILSLVATLPGVVALLLPARPRPVRDAAPADSDEPVLVGATVGRNSDG